MIKVLEKMKFSQSLSLFTLFALVTFSIWYFIDIINAPFVHDAYKLLTVNQGPSANNWNYWKYVFSNPIHGGSQYRPISYFVYFFVLKHLFGLQPLYYHIVGLCLFSSTVILFYVLMRKLNYPLVATIIASFFFITFRGNFSMLYSIASNCKYYLPMICLIIGLIISFSSNKLTIGKMSAIFLLNVIAIMTHEGSCVFPIIFILIRLVRYKFSLVELIIFIPPALIYLVMRLLVWKIPEHGFMSLDLWLIPSSIGIYLKYIYGNNFLSLFVFFILVIFAIYTYYIDKDWLPLIYVFSIIILILPFSALRHHILPNRSIFGVIPAALLIGHITLYFKKYHYLVIIPFTIYIVICSYHNKMQLDFSMPSRMEEKLLTSIRKKMKKIDNDHTIEVILLNAPARRSDFGMSIVPGILATYFPENTFTLNINVREKKRFFYVLVKQGYIYYSQDNKNWQGLLGYSESLSFVPPSSVLKIDTLLVNKINDYPM